MTCYLSGEVNDTSIFTGSSAQLLIQGYYKHEVEQHINVLVHMKDNVTTILFLNVWESLHVSLRSIVCY